MILMNSFLNQFLQVSWQSLTQSLRYTAIFLTNGLCIVYCSLLQCLTLVYPGWGQKSEFFCLLVTAHRLRSGTVAGYRKYYDGLLLVHCSQGPLKYTRVRDNRRYLVTVCLEGTSKATDGYLQ